jgi:hypothetical protein
MGQKEVVIFRVNAVVPIFLLTLVILLSGCHNHKPVITGFSPSSGQFGDTVIITGKRFSATASDNIVKFNGTTAVVSSGTSTQIVAIVPEGATTGRITVRANGHYKILL